MGARWMCSACTVSAANWAKILVFICAFTTCRICAGPWCWTIRGAARVGIWRRYNACWRQMSENTSMNSPETSFFRRHWMLGVGALAATAGAGVAWWRLQPGASQAQDVQAFWQKSFDDLNGQSVLMASLRGRPLLVNFWATWCPPCVQELPMIEAFWRQHAANGIQLMALAIYQPSAVGAFVARQGLSMPVALAGLEGTQLAKSLGNANGGLPFSVFFRADASIYRQRLGQLSQSDLDSWLS